MGLQKFLCLCLHWVYSMGFVSPSRHGADSKAFPAKQRAGGQLFCCHPSLHQFPWSKGMESEPRLQSSLDLSRHLFTKAMERPLDGPGNDVDFC